MIDNWFTPLDAAGLGTSKLEPFQLGAHLNLFSDTLPDLKEVRVALIGVGDKGARLVRRELYKLSFPFEGLQIADLGNARRAGISFLIPALKELLDSKIFPVLIAADPSLTLAQYKAFLQLQSSINLVVVDERPRLSVQFRDSKQYYLNELIHGRQARLFHLSLLGLQSHFTDPALFPYLEEKNFECVRLGRARASLEELEPIIRDGDLLSLHLSALRLADAPGSKPASPSGFHVEEACRIARYAGMSDKLKSFGVYGYRPSGDRQRQTAQLIAQMIWYFLDGFYHRKQDFPASMDSLVEYIVDFKKLDYQLVFWKSKKSGRWWMQVPVKVNEKQQRHRLVPCSYNDYKLASQEELPERLLNAFKRFS